MLAYLELEDRRRVLGTTEHRGSQLAFRPVGERHRHEPGRLLDRVEAIHASRATVLRGVDADGTPFRAHVTLARFERSREQMPELIFELASELEA